MPQRGADPMLVDGPPPAGHAAPPAGPAVPPAGPADALAARGRPFAPPPGDPPPRHGPPVLGLAAFPWLAGRGLAPADWERTAGDMCTLPMAVVLAMRCLFGTRAFVSGIAVDRQLTALALAVREPLDAETWGSFRGHVLTENARARLIAALGCTWTPRSIPFASPSAALRILRAGGADSAFALRRSDFAGAAAGAAGELEVGVLARGGADGIVLALLVSAARSADTPDLFAAEVRVALNAIASLAGAEANAADALAMGIRAVQRVTDTEAATLELPGSATGLRTHLLDLTRSASGSIAIDSRAVLAALGAAPVLGDILRETDSDALHSEIQGLRMALSGRHQPLVGVLTASSLAVLEQQLRAIAPSFPEAAAAGRLPAAVAACRAFAGNDRVTSGLAAAALGSALSAAAAVVDRGGTADRVALARRVMGSQLEVVLAAAHSGRAAA